MKNRSNGYIAASQLFFFGVLILGCSSAPVPTFAQGVEHFKVFKVSGTGNDGNLKEVTFQVKERCYDFKDDEMQAMKTFEDQVKYANGRYLRRGEPTKKQDCAGYVMDQLWKTGKYFVTGDNFYQNIIKNFGFEVSGVIWWGDVKEGDIVVYRRGDVGNHVEIVTGVFRALGMTSIRAMGKDGTESVFLHAIGNPGVDNSLLSNDPLIQAHADLDGGVRIYRVDPAKVTFTPVAPDKCKSCSSGGTPSSSNASPKVTAYKIASSVAINAENCNTDEVPEDIVANTGEVKVFRVTPGQWLSTGIQLKQGESFQITATGKVIRQGDREWGPGGYYLLGYQAYSLKAMIGDKLFDIGSSGGGVAPIDGELRLGVTWTYAKIQPDDSKLQGGFSATVTFDGKQ